MDVSAMRHRAHESAKARVQNLRCAKKRTDKPQRNKPQERSKAEADKTRQPNKKRNQRTVQSHRSRVEQNQGDNREPEHATWKEHGYNHRHGDLHTTRRQRQRRRMIKKLETMACQEGSASGKLKAAILADLKKDLEAAQQDLPQPLPRNTYARKEKEVAKLKQELHDRTAKIQSLAAVKQQLEKDASEIQKQLEQAEMERDHAFNQMSQEKNPKVADQWILDVFTSEAAIKPIVNTWTSEAAHRFWRIQRKSKPGSGNSFANI